MVPFPPPSPCVYDKSLSQTDGMFVDKGMHDVHMHASIPTAAQYLTRTGNSCLRVQVRVWYQNKQSFAGSFEEEEAAGRAYDRQILNLAGPTLRATQR